MSSCVHVFVYIVASSSLCLQMSAYYFFTHASNAAFIALSGHGLSGAKTPRQWTETAYMQPATYAPGIWETNSCSTWVT